MLESDRNWLLELARDAVRGAAEGRRPAPPATIPPALATNGAAFVSLHVAGDLRGCIGHLAPGQPLWQSVQDMAFAAATRDDRFASIGRADLPRLEVEVSVLTAFEKITGPAEITIGVHGLFVKTAFASGLLLPRVAVDHGFGAEEFLAQTCRKAGLPADAWKTKVCEISRFSADVISG